MTISAPVAATATGGSTRAFSTTLPMWGEGQMTVAFDPSAYLIDDWSTSIVMRMAAYLPASIVPWPTNAVVPCCSVSRSKDLFGVAIVTQLPVRLVVSKQVQASIFVT